MLIRELPHIYIRVCMDVNLVVLKRGKSEVSKSSTEFKTLISKMKGFANVNLAALHCVRDCKDFRIFYDS